MAGSYCPGFYIFEPAAVECELLWIWWMRIVLTGGPSAGKTTIAEALARAYWDRLSLVPESATVLFQGGFPRELNNEAVVCQQRAIYYVQRELEAVSQLRSPKKSLVCDRGTLDGLAFWPRTENEFFLEIGKTKTEELRRYDWVIHLQTASSDSYRPSTIRRETYDEAQAIDERLQHIWREHPNWSLISNDLSFSVKITRALLAVKMILDHEPKSKIQNLLNPKDQSRT